jgi:hypothetical protein
VSQVSKCGSCRAPVVWVITAAGRKMPVDAVPVDDGDFYAGEDGRYTKVQPFGDAPEGVDRFTSHFVTCPDRDEWRKPRSRTGD